MTNAGRAEARGVQRVRRVHPRSHAERVVGRARQAHISGVQEAIDRVEPTSAADEPTVLEVLGPDDVPTTLRPVLAETSDCGPQEGQERQDRDRQDRKIEPLAAVPDLAREVTFAPGVSRPLGSSSRGRVGKYELRDKLARGAFGVVYTAHDPSLDRDVAIKVLRPTHLTNPNIVQRFLQEARATARVSHPGIVTIHDCGQVQTGVGATAFIAMELLSGESLSSRLLGRGRLASETAIEIVRQVASALEAAHRADVLHRDLKPDNIYLVPDPAMPDGERVKVLDFGLAKLGHDGDTRVETVFGTPRYMSPEQCRSATQVDHRSDIYSLGCILFELVTGDVPFDGEVHQLIECHQHVAPPRARSLAPALAPALDDLIADMLAKDPMERPQTMGAVQRALHGVGEAPIAEGAPPILVQPHEPPAGRFDTGAPSGELLVPPSAAREPLAGGSQPSQTSLTGPRRLLERRATLVGLGVLVVVSSVLIAWATAG